MNLVVAGAVAAAPGIVCDTGKTTVADAATQTDATGASDKGDAVADTLAIDTSVAPDAGDDATDAYPDGVRG